MKITIVHCNLGLATDESADRLLSSLVAAHKVWSLTQLHSVSFLTLCVFLKIPCFTMINK